VNHNRSAVPNSLSSAVTKSGTLCTGCYARDVSPARLGRSQTARLRTNKLAPVSELPEKSPEDFDTVGHGCLTANKVRITVSFFPFW
jgi:hypothetical protein